MNAFFTSFPIAPSVAIRLPRYVNSGTFSTFLLLAVMSSVVLFYFFILPIFTYSPSFYAVSVKIVDPVHPCIA